MANPFMEGPAVSQPGTGLQPFREYAWDFSKNCFIYDTKGKHIILEGNEAIKIWVYKCLSVERYRYIAYFDDYGCELEQFIGKPNDGTEETELYRYIQESLLVNPYIKRVSNLSVEKDHKKIIMHLQLKTVYGDLSTEWEVNP